jgi:hypothetical protein
VRPEDGNEQKNHRKVAKSTKKSSGFRIFRKNPNPGIGQSELFSVSLEKNLIV